PTNTNVSTLANSQITDPNGGSETLATSFDLVPDTAPRGFQWTVAPAAHSGAVGEFAPSASTPTPTPVPTSTPTPVSITKVQSANNIVTGNATIATAYTSNVTIHRTLIALLRGDT